MVYRHATSDDETKVLLIVTDGVLGSRSGNGRYGDTDREVARSRDRLLDDGWIIFAAGFGHGLRHGLRLSVGGRRDRVFEANDASGLAAQAIYRTRK